MRPQQICIALISGLLSVLLFAACSRAPEKSVTVTGPHIFGGRTVLASEPIHHAVIKINFQNPDGDHEICTGSLVGKSSRRFFVLTAAHCLATRPDQMNVMIADRAVPVVAFHVHPQYENRQQAIIKEKLWSQTNQFDAAVLEIPPFEEALAFSLSSEPAPSRLEVAGYGAESYDQLSGAKVGDEALKTAPVSAARSSQTSILEFDQTLPSGICLGDSGGPAFTQNDDGSLQLFGLASSVRHPGSADVCKGVSRFILVASLADWLSVLTH